MTTDVDLTGTSWRVVDLGGDPVGEDGAPSVSFGADGRAGGHAGVNRWFATWEQSGTSITFGPAGTTRMAGPPDRMEQEQRFLAALAGVSDVSVADDALTLTGADVSMRLLGVETEEGTPDEPVSEGTALRGSVAYRERVALPEGAIVSVVLEDVSLADAPSTVIAETSFTPTGQVPLDFELALPADAFADDRRRFGLRARIEVDGALAWTTDTHHPVDAANAGERHDLRLVAVGGA